MLFVACAMSMLMQCHLCAQGFAISHHFHRVRQRRLSRARRNPRQSSSRPERQSKSEAMRQAQRTITAAVEEAAARALQLRFNLSMPPTDNEELCMCVREAAHTRPCARLPPHSQGLH